jgi:mevalonate kinase
MPHSEHRYPAKLLLFGEHLLLRGATALAVPVPAFGGAWMRTEGDKPPFAAELRRFAEWLSEADFDRDRLLRDLHDGWYFASDIPQGYGLGSSGALCAAIYTDYARQPHAADTPAGLAALKTLFGQMEGYFHGQSSGIDPLTSYVGQPLLVQQQHDVSMPHPQPWSAGEAPVVFLLDSQQPRRTGPLVSWFLEQSTEPAYATMLAEQMLPAHQQLLDGWLRADSGMFWPGLRRISRLQWQHMPPMIPANLREAWAKQLEHSDATLKICGAGGGGFVLGFARSVMAAQQLAEGLQLPIIWPFGRG